MTVFVCRADGTQVGEFDEAEFRDKVFARQITAEEFYWHEGMADWRPVSDYRALAKTQRISFAPPVRPTVKIDISKSEPAQSSTKPNPISCFLDRLRGKK